ncbi:J domain-containing protein [Natronorubrum halophilum]|uniref:J domain-containing protein n=1 Tax=Natronorubrum halophilum TaxID=1702106 RepID=UPI000EF63FFB|nr:J domain-containing protein [Natronorubrum halophilum]
MESHYEALGLPLTADDRAVRRAYRALLKDHHPDQGGSREQFLRIKGAYEAIIGERPPEDHEPNASAIEHSDGELCQSSRPTYDPDEGDGETTGNHGLEGLTVSSTHLAVTLSALVHDVPLERLVDGHVPAAADRTVAFFRVQNTGSQTLSWQGTANTSFIGDDGFLYEGSSIVTPHAERLPERWCGIDVDIAPGMALDAIVIAQEIPTDVTVETVMYTQRVPDPEGTADDGIERYLFELRPLVRERLDRLPFSA